MLRRRILTVMVAVSVLIATGWVGNANAAQTAQVGGNALKVSPVRLDVKMDPGTSQTIEVTIQNLTSVPSTLHAAINDFVAAGDESGRPNVILNENEYAPSHSLKRLARPVSDFTLQPGETKNVKVTINVPNDAAAGGYYGTVRFAPANAEGDKNVNLAASVGTLVLLKVSGDLHEELSVASFDVRKKDKAGAFFMDHKNLKATVRFKNSGNVQVEPFGTVILKRFGKVVGQYEINDRDVRSSVLPDSVRRYDVPLSKVSPFGKYTAVGNFGYGEAGQLLTAQTTFYVVPLPFILAGVGIVALIVFLAVVLPRMIRAYNRRIIRRANRRR